MHERAYVLAWPYPGRHRLPVELLAWLDGAGLLPASDQPTRQHQCLCGDRAVVLAGDSAADRSSPVRQTGAARLARR